MRGGGGYPVKPWGVPSLQHAQVCWKLPEWGLDAKGLLLRLKRITPDGEELFWFLSLGLFWCLSLQLFGCLSFACLLFPRLSFGCLFLYWMSVLLTNDSPFDVWCQSFWCQSFPFLSLPCLLDAHTLPAQSARAASAGALAPVPPRAMGVGPDFILIVGWKNPYFSLLRQIGRLRKTKKNSKKTPEDTLPTDLQLSRIVS